METITGIIEDKRTKYGKKKDGKPWELNKYKVMNKWFSTFEEEDADYKIGKYVTIEYTTNDKGNDVVKMYEKSDTHEVDITPDSFICNTEVETYVMLTRERFLDLAEQVRANPNKKTILIKV